MKLKNGGLFRRGCFKRASGGPVFSALPEKKGEKRGAWLRLVRPASEFRQTPMFQFGVPLGGHLTYVLIRAA